MAAFRRAPPAGAFTGDLQRDRPARDLVPLHWTEDGLPVGVQLVGAVRARGPADPGRRAARAGAALGRPDARRCSPRLSRVTLGRMSEIRGVLTAMVTPFDDGRRGRPRRGPPRWPATWSRTAPHGLVVAGTTGEAPTLADDEKMRLLRRRPRRGRRRGDRDLRHRLQRHPPLGRADRKAAAEAGADAVLVVTPVLQQAEPRPGSGRTSRPSPRPRGETPIVALQHPLAAA